MPGQRDTFQFVAVSCGQLEVVTVGHNAQGYGELIATYWNPVLSIFLRKSSFEEKNSKNLKFAIIEDLLNNIHHF